MADFYKSKRWLKLRAAALRRDRHQCQLEARRGRLVEAQVVHHIFPREQFPEYQWELWNLISVTAENHKQLHEKYGGKLSTVGERLRAEVAAREGIKLSRLVLVCGLPGSGKTTYTKDHLMGGLCYDLDAIAGAFRLEGPHGPRHDAARRMANTMALPFAVNARHYAGLVFVIRTAPKLYEVERLEPDEIVICNRPPHLTPDMDPDEMTRRLCELREWAEANRIPVEEAG